MNGPAPWGILRSCSKIASRPQRAEAATHVAQGSPYTNFRTDPFGQIVDVSSFADADVIPSVFDSGNNLLTAFTIDLGTTDLPDFWGIDRIVSRFSRSPARSGISGPGSLGLCSSDDVRVELLLELLWRIVAIENVGHRISSAIDLLAHHDVFAVVLHHSEPV